MRKFSRWFSASCKIFSLLKYQSVVIMKICVSLKHQITTKIINIMKLIKLTADEIRNHSIREYNPYEWNRTVDRFAKYSDVQFYMATETGNSYRQFYATYTTDEGITFFNEVSYTTVISNAGFSRIEIHADGTYTKHLYGPEQKGYIENCPSNRRIMAGYSKNFGHIFTNCSI